MLFCIYVDDLIKELRLSGYGTHLCNLFIGSILYADDIRLLSYSCFGLQKMLDICYSYRVTWDILFNPVKSHLITFGGSTPKATPRLDNDTLGWSSKIKYLVLYLTGGQGRINTKLGLMLLPRQGPIFFSAFKTDQDPCDATTLY